MSKLPKATIIAALFLSFSAGCAHADDKLLERVFETYEQELERKPDNVRLLSALGKAYYSAGNFSRAQELFEHALELEPTRVDLQIDLGLSYLHYEKIYDSQRLLEKAIEKEPENPDVLSALGWIEQLEYEYKKAEDYYVRALEIDPDNVSALTYLGTLRLEQKRFSEALELFKKVHRIDPDNKWVQTDIKRAKLGSEIELIKELDRAGDIKQAEELYQEFLTHNRDFLDIYLLLGDLYVRTCRPLKAIEVYQRGLSHGLSPIALWNAMGLAYLESDNLNLASTYFEKVLEKEPHNPAVLSGMGKIAILSGREEKGEELLNEALLYRNYNLEALTYLSDLMIKQRRYEEAKILYEKILKINPNAVWARKGLLQAQFGEYLDEIEFRERKGEYERAKELHRNLIEASNDNELFYELLGDFFFRRRDYREAIDTYNQGLRVNPTSPTLLTKLGFTYLETGELYKSEGLFKEAKYLDPRNVEALVGLGALAEKDENWTKAESYYERALARDSKNFNASLYLGNLLLKQKRYKEAERIFRQLRRRSPEAKWLDKLIFRAKHGATLDEIQERERRGDFYTTERLYLNLIAESPEFADYYLLLGEFYMENNRPQAAEIVYLQGLEESPQSIPLLTSLGYAYLNQNKLGKSAHFFQKVLKREPENADALAGLAKIAEKENDRDKAEEKYLQVLRLQPDNLFTLTSLGNLYLDEGRYEIAEQIFRRLAVLSPDSQWVKFTLQDIRFAPLLEEIAALKMVDGLPKKEKIERQILAETLYRRLLNKAPDNPNYYMGLGQLLMEMDRYEEAEQVYRRGLDAAPDALLLETAIGFSYIEQKNYEAAKKEFLNVLNRQPENAEALAGLGRTAELTGRLAEAEIYYQDALSVDPRNITALSFLGGLQKRQKNYEKALATFKELLTIEPEKPWVIAAVKEAEAAPFLDRAKTLEDQGEYEQAIELLNQTLSQGHDALSIYLALGRVYATLTRYSEAAGIYKKGLAKYPHSIELQNAIGIAYTLNKDLEEGKKWLLKVLDQMPDNAEALAGLGKIQLFKDNPMKAENYFLEALSINPDNITALSFYGGMLVQEKRYEESVAIYDHLMDLEPQAKWIRQGRSRALNAPLIDGASSLMGMGEKAAAKQNYLKLFSRTAYDAENYLLLGFYYLSQERLDMGLWAFHQGLVLEPESNDLWKAVANVYLNLRNVSASIKVYNYLLGKNPEDADAWAGLGRALALKGCYWASLYYYEYALEIDPDNENALTHMARGEVEQQRYFSAGSIYGKLSSLKPEDMWVQKAFRSSWLKTRPTLTFDGGYYEEDEWDRDLKDWVARYQVYGVGVRAASPINDYFSLSGYGRIDHYRLVNMLNDMTIYFFDVARVYIETRRAFCPNWFADVNLGISGYNPAGNATFCQEDGIVVEPTVLLTWSKPGSRANFGLDSDTNLVGRNFEENKAKMVPRYYLLGSYEHEIFDKLILGLEGGLYYLKGFEDNFFQRAYGFGKWYPNALGKNISFLYYIQYQNFNKVIPEYWSYAPQFVNHLQIEYEKEFCDYGVIRAGYGHGWQNSRTRFAQIIIGLPPIFEPMFWDRRAYDTVFLRTSYDEYPLKVSVEGSFYRDSEKYTIWFINLNLGWIF